MAVINKLRNSGIVVVAIVFALAAFIISDLIANYNKQGGAIEDNSVGTINGEPIQTGEYDQLLKEYERNLLVQSQGKPLDQSQTLQIRQQAWNKIFSDNVLLKEYSKLGLVVSLEEQDDLLFGKDPHATIKYFFNPLFKEGEPYDNMKVKATVQQMSQNPEAKAQVNQVLEAVVGDVLDQKYNAMVKNTMYVTKLEAEEEIKMRNTRLDGKIVVLKADDLSQDSVSYTDADLEAYLAEHKEEFKQEQSVDFEYVKWNIIPSKQDSMTALNFVSKKYNDFKTVSNDSIFLEINSESGYDTNYTSPSDLPLALSRNLTTLSKGDMYGPDYSNGVYSVYKVLDIKYDTNMYMNTSHILFKTGPGIKPEDVKDKADKLLSQIKRGEISWSDAVNQSEDLGSARDDGYIGWFTDDGKLVQEFVDFAKTRNKGDMGVTKSQFGYHIIKINENKTNKLVKVGSIDQMVEAGRETRKRVLDIATTFRRTIKTGDENAFQLHSEANKLFPSVARNVEEKTKQVSGISDSKNITDWAFDKIREEGDISPVLSIGNTQYVVHITNIREKGYAELDDVKEAIITEVKIQKRLEAMKAKLEVAMKDANSIEQVAINLKTIAHDLNSYSLFDNNVPQAGNDNILRGNLSTAPKEKIIGPIVGKTGVYAFIITKVDFMEAKEDELAAIQQEKARDPKMSSKQWAESTLKKIYEVEDYRYKFYD